MTRPKRNTPSKYRRTEPESKVANVCTQTELSREGLEEIISQFIQSQNQCRNKANQKSKTEIQNGELVKLTSDEWLIRFGQRKQVCDSVQGKDKLVKSSNEVLEIAVETELVKEPEPHTTNQMCVKVETDNVKYPINHQDYGNGDVGDTDRSNLVNAEDSGEKKVFSPNKMHTRSDDKLTRSSKEASTINVLSKDKRGNIISGGNVEIIANSAGFPEQDVKIDMSVSSLLHHKCDICSEVFKVRSELLKHRKDKHDGFVSKCDQCNRLFSTRSKMEIHCRLHTGDKPYKCDQCGRKYYDISTLRKHVIKTKHKCNELIFERIKATNVKSTARKLPCEICGKVLGNLKTLRLHMKLHDGFNCEECRKPFANDRSLQQHLKMKHAEKRTKRRRRKAKIPNVCPVCQHSTKHYVRHMLTHLSDVRNMCKFCAKILDSEEELLSHLDTHTPDEIEVCDICGKAFGSRGRLNEHKRIHQRAVLDQRPVFTCHLCNMGFLEEVQLHKHVECHTNKSNFKCVQCTETFFTTDELKAHIFSHKGEKSPVNCPICDIVCPTKNWYSRHKVKKHTKNHMCSVCGKQFSNNLDLTRHTMLHTGNFKHKCTICGKGFLRLEKLNLHMCIHSGEKPFSCEHCGCTFYMESLLNRHLLQHDTSSDMVCTECNLSFQDQAKLDRHLREHRKNFPIMCAYCDLAFVDTRYRRNHMRSVHGIKDFVCNVCSQDFNCRVDLINHRSSVHGPEYIYTCNTCNKRFVKKTDLTVHTRKTHRKGIQVPTLTLKHEDPDAEISKVSEQALKQVKQKGKFLKTESVAVSREMPCSLCGKNLDENENSDVPQMCHQCRMEIDSNVVTMENCTENILLEIPSEIAAQGPSPGALTCLSCSKTFVLFDNFIAHMHEHPELQIKVETVQ